jgi:ribosome maturation factor RimP
MKLEQTDTDKDHTMKMQKNNKAKSTNSKKKILHLRHNLKGRVKRGTESSLFCYLYMQYPEIEKWVNQGLTELGLTDMFLIECRIKGNRIEIFLDSDESVNFLKCQKMSRWLEAILDEKKTFGDNYILEVSSAGVGSPLRFLRQYHKNIGRIIDIKYGDGKQVKGVLTKVEGETIQVEFETKVKEGKKNKKVNCTEQIKFEEIIESKIKISFN